MPNPQSVKPQNFREATFKIDGKEITVAGMARPNYQKPGMPKLSQTDQSMAYLKDNNYSVMISLETQNKQGVDYNFSAAAKAENITYHPFNTTDYTPPSIDTCKKVFSIISEAAKKGQKVAIHCGEGFGRTGTVLASIQLKLLVQSMTEQDIVNQQNVDDLEIELPLKGDNANRKYFAPQPIKQAIEQIRNISKNSNSSVENELQLERLKEYYIQLKTDLAKEKKWAVEIPPYIPIVKARPHPVLKDNATDKERETYVQEAEEYIIDYQEGMSETTDFSRFINNIESSFDYSEPIDLSNMTTLSNAALEEIQKHRANPAQYQLPEKYQEIANFKPPENDNSNYAGVRALAANLSPPALQKTKKKEVTKAIKTPPLPILLEENATDEEREAYIMGVEEYIMDYQKSINETTDFCRFINNIESSFDYSEPIDLSNMTTLSNAALEEIQKHRANPAQYQLPEKYQDIANFKPPENDSSNYAGVRALAASLSPSQTPVAPKDLNQTQNNIAIAHKFKDQLNDIKEKHKPKPDIDNNVVSTNSSTNNPR